jgi:type III secretory pathway lipoprotein EscJ
MVVVYSVTLPQNIYLPQSLLEANGIVTLIKDELTAQVHNFYSTAIGGVKLMVHEDDAARAVELLTEGGYIEV